MMLPLQNITQVITPVMHPIFSDFQNDKGKLLSSYERIVRFLAFIGLPLSVLLFFTAEEVTLIIFGDQWMPSVPVFRILSLSVGIQIILLRPAPSFRRQAIHEVCLCAECFRPRSTWREFCSASSISEP